MPDNDVQGDTKWQFDVDKVAKEILRLKTDAVAADQLFLAYLISLAYEEVRNIQMGKPTSI
ncbi:hypothetical protein [Rhizobium sp. FKY42]|uniref:hypothetical protein n=1 Tax=Rhizobium sp. FKY42 TaxID=2562310 RepID=UPI0010C06F7C|nr:hypothetical protein [Rhizobium sp. FKY42]